MPDTDQAAPAVTDTPSSPPPQLYEQPDCAIDWERSTPTAGLLAAIARGQARIETVGKSGENTHHKYHYAPADTLVGEMRRAFAAEGVGVLFSWRTYDPPFQLPKGSKQWVDWQVVLDWALVHGGEDGAIGVLRGTASIIALGDAGRGADKSMLAARTALAGALALSLAQIDRDEVDPSESTDARADEASRRESGARNERRLSPVARAKAEAALRTLLAARRTAGHRHEGRPVTPAKVFSDLMGEGWTMETDADAAELVERVEETMAALQAASEGGAA